MKTRFLFIAVAGLLLAADDKPTPEQKDYDQFLGTWTFQLVKIDGKEMPHERGPSLKMLVYGPGRYTVTQKTGSVRGTFKLDASRTPKFIDITLTDGRLKG